MTRIHGGLRLAALAAAFLAAGFAQAQTISTVAGTGVQGYSGDGGPATAAQIRYAYGSAVDAQGNRYIVDTDSFRIRKVKPDGTITTIAGTGLQGFSGDGGPATAARLSYTYRMAVDAAGNIYLADYGNNRIRKIDTSGVITTIVNTAGMFGYAGDGAAATSAATNGPVGIAVDAAGNLFFSDYNNCAIRKVGVNGIISTVAGTGTCGQSGDGGPATAALLGLPLSVSVDGAGNLYIPQYQYYRVRKVDAVGTITTIAGNGTYGNTGDGGPATQASLSQPWDAKTDSGGNLYIADAGAHSIRKVTPAGTISTVAGTGTQGFNGDGIPATTANLYVPTGVAVGGGKLYINDTGNARFRVISLFTTCAAEGYTGAKLTMCRQVCEGTATGSTLASLVKMYVTLYKEQPACSR